MTRRADAPATGPAEPPEAPAPSAPPERPDVSILIPTFRRPDQVVRTVAAWTRQATTASLEVVVVDDGSDDGTAERLASLARDDPRVRPHRQPNGGRAAARNAALERARGRTVVFLDDDVTPVGDDVLERWTARVRRDGGAWVARLRVPDRVVRTPVQRAWRGHLEGGTERRADGSDLGRGGFWFAALAVARDDVGDARFDERFGGYGWEDLELGYRLHRSGLRSRITREVEVWHEDAVELAGLERKHELFGRAGWAFAAAHPRLEVRLWTGTWWPVRAGKALLGVERRGAAAHARIAACADDPGASGPGGFARDLRAALEGAYARGVRLGAP